MEVSLSAAKSRILMFVFVMCVQPRTHTHTHRTVTGEQKVSNEEGEWRNREGIRDPLIAECSCSS